MNFEYVDVYTDGACTGNGKSTGRCGLGVYWGENHILNISQELIDDEPKTCIRAEINAAILALKQAKKHNIPHIRILTDSKFLISVATQWIKKWKSNGFKKNDGTNVLNKKDILILDELCQIVDVKWVHVKGHSGNLGNDNADHLAKSAIIS